jgi:hypothetical protein
MNVTIVSLQRNKKKWLSQFPEFFEDFAKKKVELRGVKYFAC